MYRVMSLMKAWYTLVPFEILRNNHLSNGGKLNQMKTIRCELKGFSPITEHILWLPPLKSTLHNTDLWNRNIVQQQQVISRFQTKAC